MLDSEGSGLDFDLLEGILANACDAVRLLKRNGNAASQQRVLRPRGVIARGLGPATPAGTSSALLTIDGTAASSFAQPCGSAPATTTAGQPAGTPQQNGGSLNPQTMVAVVSSAEPPITTFGEIVSEKGRGGEKATAAITSHTTESTEAGLKCGNGGDGGSGSNAAAALLGSSTPDAAFDPLRTFVSEFSAESPPNTCAQQRQQQHTVSSSEVLVLGENTHIIALHPNAASDSGRVDGAKKAKEDTRAAGKRGSSSVFPPLGSASTSASLSPSASVVANHCGESEYIVRPSASRHYLRSLQEKQHQQQQGGSTLPDVRRRKSAFGGEAIPSEQLSGSASTNQQILLLQRQQQHRNSNPHPSQSPQQQQQESAVPHGYGGSLSSHVAWLIHRIAEAANVAPTAGPPTINARSCVVCGSSTDCTLVMRANGYKCEGCLGRPSGQRFTIVPEEHSSLEFYGADTAEARAYAESFFASERLQQKGAVVGGSYHTNERKDGQGAAMGRKVSFGASSSPSSSPSPWLSPSPQPLGLGARAASRNFGDDLIHSIVNGYFVESRLGKGAYGAVYQVHHRTNPMTKFAAKAVPVRRAGRSAAEAAQAGRELLIMKTLDHPSLIRIVAIVNDPQADTLFIIMEKLGRAVCEVPTEDSMAPATASDGGGGGNPRHQPLPLNTVRRHLAGVASGLAYLHAKGIFHRDIKPDNLLVDDSGNVRVTDFGVSATSDGGGLDVVHGGCGTIFYFPPENFGAALVRGRAQDVWSLGITLFIMAFATFPFPLKGFGRETVESFELSCPKDADPDLVDLLSLMLRKDPSRRITARDIMAHPFIANVHFSKGYPAAPETLRLGCVVERSSSSGSGSSGNKSSSETTGEALLTNAAAVDAAKEFDGLFVIAERSAEEPALAALRAFIDEEGPEFQVAPSAYSTTLYAMRRRE